MEVDLLLADDFKSWYQQGLKARSWHSNVNDSPKVISEAWTAIAANVRAEKLTRWPSPFFEVKKSVTGGLGCFARQDIAKGTEIFMESPLFQSMDGDVQREYAKLSPKAKNQFSQLHGYKEIADNPVTAIFRTNRFRTSCGLCGIFLISSRFNHSCYPSCRYWFFHDSQTLKVTATRNIQKGEEMTINYGSTPENLAMNYGFLCQCGFCTPPEFIPLPPWKW